MAHSTDTPDTPSTLFLLNLAKRHKGLIAFATVAGLALGVIYSANRSPVYKSSAQLMVIKKQGNPLPTGDPDPRASYYEDYLATHQVLLRSPLIVGRAVDRGKLQSLRSFRSLADPTGAIRESLLVVRDSKDPSAPSSVLNLDFRAVDPEDCATVLNAVVDAYKDFLDEKYKNVSDATLAQIVTAMQSLQKDLQEKKRQYLLFQQESPLVYLRGSEGVAPQEEWLAQIQARRLGLLLRRAEVQGRLQGIEGALKEGRGRQVLLAQLLATSPKSVSNGTPGADRRVDEQLFDLQLKEQMLLADYGEDHPDVLSLRRRIDLTRSFLTKDMAGVKHGGGPDLTDPVQWHVQGLRQELADIDLALRTTTELADSELKEARQVMRFKLEDKHHREEIARLQQMFEPIIRRLEEIKLIRDLGGFDAQVIAPPGIGALTGIGLVQILLASGALGLVGGFGLAYLMEISDKTFRTPEEIQRRLKLPVVGHIPVLKVDEEKVRQSAASGIAADPFLCTVHQPKSVQAESFRGVRTALYFTTSGEVHKVIQITSPNQGDGKSTTAANLAVSIAQSGKKTLLIDADLRRPRLHKMFGLSADVGLATVIGGGAGWQEAAQPTGIDGLSLLPCGPIPSNPAELLSSPKFPELLETLRDSFDFIIVDTPPILAVSDPCVVAPRVDGVVLTIRILKNGRSAAERACEILGTLGAKILGVVVNGGSHGGNGYGYGSGSGYDSAHYGYGYGYYHGGSRYYQEDGTPERPAVGAAGPAVAHAPRKHRKAAAPQGLWGRLVGWWQS